MESVSRNAPCPCGSGRKYKRCCERVVPSATKENPPWLGIVLGAIVVLAAVGLLAGVWRGDPEKSGRVWSAEHGHWHYPGQTHGAAQPGTPATPGTAPPGTAPPGKVWSEEHGHWHDAP
jgi:hypothetical protein